MLVQPDAISYYRTVNQRLLYVLNLAPWSPSFEMLRTLCADGLAFPDQGTRKGLERLREVGDAEKVLREGKTKRYLWRATKWSRAPQGVREMGESLRESLPSRRRCITQSVRIFPPEGGHQSIHYSIGLYPDGRPAELFIDVAKAGAALRGWCGEAGMMLSIALQHGAPLRTVLDLFVGTRNDPNGRVEGHPRITQCTSIMDLIARDLAITFLGREDLADCPDWSTVPVPISDKAELPPPIEGQTCVCHQSRTDQSS